MLLPPFDPESTTSVYSVSTNGRPTYYVTDISAAANLWQRTDGVRYPTRAKDIKVKRLDAQIPKRTAQLIKEVWLQVLKGPNGPRPIQPPPRVIALDVTHAEFSLARPDAAPLRGDLDFSLSFPGRRTKQLVDILNRLYDYCKAGPSERPAIAEKIDRQATHLLADLRSR
jgi:hypothetical protein